MRVLASRSEVATDEAGWVWLRPQAASLRYRHILASLLLAVVVLAGTATATLLDPPLALPATAVPAGLAVALARRVARDGHTRVGLSAAGVLLIEGAGVTQLGWTAVEGLQAVGGPGRVRIALAAGRESRTTRATFEAGPARAWLERAATEASRRQLHPVRAPDGAGFTTG